jgi:hypothetical protein
MKTLVPHRTALVSIYLCSVNDSWEPVLATHKAEIPGTRRILRDAPIVQFLNRRAKNDIFLNFYNFPIVGYSRYQ